jgi:hypothetical protein
MRDRPLPAMLVVPTKGGAMSSAPTQLARGRPSYHWRLLLLAAVLLAVAVALLIRHEVFQGSSSSAPVQGSGIAARDLRHVPSFGALELSGSNNVVVHVGVAQSVVVHADKNLLGHVKTNVHGGTLVVGTVGSSSGSTPMSVEVAVPSLNAVTLSGSGTIVATGIRSSRFTVTLSGSGSVRGAGAVRRHSVTVSGSGDAQLENLVSRNSNATVSGAGRIVVNATGVLIASVPGTGAIFYVGQPTVVTTSVTGTGTVMRG